jgi:hypothetical protein
VPSEVCAGSVKGSAQWLPVADVRRVPPDGDAIRGRLGGELVDILLGAGGQCDGGSLAAEAAVSGLTESGPAPMVVLPLAPSCPTVGSPVAATPVGQTPMSHRRLIESGQDPLSGAVHHFTVEGRGAVGSLDE